MLEFFKTDVGKVALGGVIGVAGPLIASLIAWGKEYWFDTSKRRREAEYLAMRLVLVFDELTTACYNVVHDPLVEDQEGCSEATVGHPTLSLPTDGDYKALPRRLMFQIMSMPSKIDGISEGMSSAYEFSGPPNYDEFFEYRREHWAKLGLQSLNLIDALCREYKIPPPDRPEYYEPRASFQKELVEIEQDKRDRDESSSKMTASMFVNSPNAEAEPVMSHDPIDDWIDKAIEADPIELDIDEIDEPSGPPLSAEEIEAARASLAQWQAPDVFKVAVDALCAHCTSKDWFNRPQLKFLHDAFVLARFARHQRVDQVRLAEPSAQWPDGFARIAEKVHNIEVTGTHGGRELGKEYREVKGPTMDPVENWVARGDSIPKYLDEAVGAKSRKRYGAPCWLVVYLNISEYGIRQKETETTIAQIKSQYALEFEAISVLWKGRLY